MIRPLVAATLACALAAAAGVSAQTKKAVDAKKRTYDVTIKVDQVYTGTMEVVVEGGKVTGSMLLTSPTEITGKVAGTEKKGVLDLAFPYVITERKCEGNVTMQITMPAKPGPASGTMEATECGGDPSNRAPGTIDLVPATPKAK
jgi:hypothetical protein